MDDTLLQYYESELAFIRQMGAEFAKKYPKIAARLLLEPDKSEDPHTERLIEAFAFLCARVHKKIDDHFPEITEALLSIVFPHYIRPVPSMTVVHFDPKVKNVPPSGHTIPKGTLLYSKPVAGVSCRFETTYPVTLWPVEVADARFKDPVRAVKGAIRALVLRFQTEGGQPISELRWDRIRFFLNGSSSQVFHLYELLANHACFVELRATDPQGNAVSAPLSARHIRPVGFEPDENVLPLSKPSFSGYQLLMEYFTFPEKFLFFEVSGMERTRTWESTDHVELWIYLDRHPQSSLVINPETFALNASPAINLFRRIAEPIRVDRSRTEYLVIPDIRRREAVEIFDVVRVTATTPKDPDEAIEFKPFYSIEHHLENQRPEGREVFYHLSRKPSMKEGDPGTEVYLSFCEPDFTPTAPDVEVLTVHTICLNRDLPSRLPFGDSAGDFDLEIAAPVTAVRCLIKPTVTRRPELGSALQWRLISHLSLNYLSLVEGGEKALKEMLTLYDFDGSPATRQQIEGIVRLHSRPVTRRIGNAYARGIEVTAEFDEDKYVGAGLYLFCSVLEHFLGQYASINSFTQFVARTLQKKEPLKRWPPRSGRRILI